MNTTDSFDRRLSVWLGDEAQGRVPDHLAEVLVMTRATRQRPGWSSLERWLPMTSIASVRLFAPRPLLPILVVVSLLALAVAAAILVETGRPTIPPFGKAGNGRIVYVDGNSLKSVTADGVDPQVIATLPPSSGGPAISPDGTLVAVAAPGARVQILAVARGAGQTPITVTAPGMTDVGGETWSPSGDRVAFVGSNDHGDHVFIADADGTHLHEVTSGLVADGHVVSLAGFSPDGRLVAFSEGANDSGARLVVVAPDGSGARALKTNLVGAALAWSPDPATSRVLYQAYGGPLDYYDLATNTDVYVAIGFWASWSPTGDRISYWHDGTKVLATPASSAGTRSPVDLFPEFQDCGDHPELAGKALCGPVTWSPDGTRVIGTEVTGNGLLSLLSNGAGDPRFIDLATNVDMGAGGIVAWQPVVQR